MKRLGLLVLLVLTASDAQAASYLRIDGVTIDPIQNVSGGDNPYSGTNLGPSTTLAHVDLSGANLIGAVLNDAILTDANLSGTVLAAADLTGALLSAANLSDAIFGSAYSGLNVILTGTDLTRANLSGVAGLAFVTGIPSYDTLTNFTGAWTDHGTIPFDPVAAGWNLVPEPSTALLFCLGLVGLSSRRRSMHAVGIP